MKGVCPINLEFGIQLKENRVILRYAGFGLISKDLFCEYWSTSIIPANQEVDAPLMNVLYVSQTFGA